MKTVIVKGSECLVESLTEWIESRINQLANHNYRRLITEDSDPNTAGRLAELQIIREKVLDGRIQEI